MKLEEFLNLNQGNMSVEEYSLKFSMLSKFDPSLVSNHRDAMSRFVTGVADLVREAMLHDDITLARLLVYTQSTKESKLGRNSRTLKMSG